MWVAGREEAAGGAKDGKRMRKTGSEREKWEDWQRQQRTKVRYVVLRTDAQKGEGEKRTEWSRWMLTAQTFLGG